MSTKPATSLVGAVIRVERDVLTIIKTNRRSSLSQDRYRGAIGGVDYLLGFLHIPQR